MSSGSILVALTSEEDRDLACEILRDLIGVSIATTSVWALITIMFRHVLVKYSERGLVSGGGVSPLFGQLYLTVTLASSAVSYTVVASRHFHTESPPAMLKYSKLQLKYFNPLSFGFIRFVSQFFV